MQCGRRPAGGKVARLKACFCLLGLVLLHCVGGCSEAPAAVEPGAIAGADCGPEVSCAAGLLCVDGRCSPRPWPPDVVGAEDVVAPIDLGVVAPADTAEDDIGVDAPDTVATTRVWIGEHTAAVAASDDAVTLQVEQAAVFEAEAPTAGRVVALEVMAVAPAGATACGVFRVVVWVPDAAGAWPMLPTWTGPERALVGSPLAQTVLEPDGPAVPAGPVRVGLLFAAGCPDTAHPPRVLLDASGETGGTWVWARVGAAAAWISGASLGLSGRWALRAALDTP